MIGKMSVVALAVFVVIAIAAARVPSEWAILLLVLIAVAVFFAFLAVLGRFAMNNPDLAATEGAHYVQTRRIAAKGQQALPPTIIVTDPENPTLLGLSDQNGQA